MAVMKRRPETQPYIVTGRMSWSPFFGRTLYSGWDIDGAVRMARSIAVSDSRYGAVAVSRGDAHIMTIDRMESRFGHTFSERWA